MVDELNNEMSDEDGMGLPEEDEDLGRRLLEAKGVPAARPVRRRGRSVIVARRIDDALLPAAIRDTERLADAVVKYLRAGLLGGRGEARGALLTELARHGRFA